jgi:hypothetical protein
MVEIFELALVSERGSEWLDCDVGVNEVLCEDLRVNPSFGRRFRMAVSRCQYETKSHCGGFRVSMDLERRFEWSEGDSEVRREETASVILTSVR